MKEQPFYSACVCTKVSGGKKPLWQARFDSTLVEKGRGLEAIASLCSRLGRLIGAGGTADLAIKDLKKQINY